MTRVVDCAAETFCADVTSIPECGPGLSTGSAGVAVFLSCLAKARRESRWQQQAEKWLEMAIRGFGRQPLSASLFSGTVGLAWVLNQFNETPQPSHTDLLDKVDRCLLAHVSGSPWRGRFDLVSGLVGIGVYALERTDRNVCASIVAAVVNRLKELSLPIHDGIVWWTTPETTSNEERVHFPRGYCDFGVAHGLPGVVSWLARVSTSCRLDTTTVDVARELACGGLRALLVQQNPPGSDSDFVGKIDLFADRKRQAQTSLAWCYGDLGVSAVLHVAASMLDKPVWQQHTLDVAKRAATRSLKVQATKDVGLCHGAAGTAHMFNRLYQATGDSLFADAARHWIDLTLGLHTPDEGIGGFRAWCRERSGRDRWVGLPGLLRGAAGISLALMAATSAIPPRWDDVLLLSRPHGTLQ